VVFRKDYLEYLGTGIFDTRKRWESRLNAVWMSEIDVDLLLFGSKKRLPAASW